MHPAVLTLKKIISNKYVIISIVLVVILFLARGGYRKWKAKRDQKRFDENEGFDANQLALQYRSASNPSGINWMIDFDGTKDDIILEQLAPQTKGNFEAVTDAYRLKYDGETLSDRMLKELDAQDYNTWRNIVIR